MPPSSLRRWPYLPCFIESDHATSLDLTIFIELPRVICDPSRLQVEQRLARREIHRHRDVVVHDAPLAVDLAQPARDPPPHAGRPAVLELSAHPLERRDERHVAADGDVEVADLVVERAFVLGEEVFVVLPILPAG